jgi:hypothetical protein
VDRGALVEVTGGIWPITIDTTVNGVSDTNSDLTLLLLPPLLGPTAGLLLHRMAYTHPTRWTTDEFAAQFGITGSKVAHALGRICDFGFAEIVAGQIIIPARPGPLHGRARDSLPDRLGAIHDRIVEQHRPPH